MTAGVLMKAAIGRNVNVGSFFTRMISPSWITHTWICSRSSLQGGIQLFLRRCPIKVLLKG